MAREVCSCGAAFHSWTMRAVREWRTEHRHDATVQEPEPQGTTSQVEHSYQGPHDDSERYTPEIIARIGFTPNRVES